MENSLPLLVRALVPDDKGRSLGDLAGEKLDLLAPELIGRQSLAGGNKGWRSGVGLLTGVAVAITLAVTSRFLSV